MKALFHFALSLLVSASLASAADPDLFMLVMPDAKALAGIQVERAKASMFGQFLLSLAQPKDAAFDQFVTSTGFDPRRDLKEVLTASSDETGSPKGLVLARGNFNSTRILSWAKDHGQSTETYKGVAILVGKHAGAAALLDNSLAIVGDIASVRAAIDRRTSPTQLPSILASKAAALRASHDAWGVSVLPPNTWAQRIPDQKMGGMLQGDVIKSIEQTSGGVKFGTIIEISGEAISQTEKDANTLAEVVRFFANMLQMNAPQPAAQFASLLKTLNVSTESRTVKISLSIPELDLENIIQTNRTRASLR